MRTLDGAYRSLSVTICKFVCLGSVSRCTRRGQTDQCLPEFSSEIHYTTTARKTQATHRTSVGQAAQAAGPKIRLSGSRNEHLSGKALAAGKQVSLHKHPRLAPCGSLNKGILLVAVRSRDGLLLNNHLSRMLASPGVFLFLVGILEISATACHSRCSGCNDWSCLYCDFAEETTIFQPLCLKGYLARARLHDRAVLLMLVDRQNVHSWTAPARRQEK